MIRAGVKPSGLKAITANAALLEGAGVTLSLVGSEIKAIVPTAVHPAGGIGFIARDSVSADEVVDLEPLVVGAHVACRAGGALAAGARVDFAIGGLLTANATGRLQTLAAAGAANEIILCVVVA